MERSGKPKTPGPKGSGGWSSARGSWRGTDTPSVRTLAAIWQMHCAPVSVLQGAAVLKQFSYKSAMKHKALVAEIACNAKTTGQLPILGVVYDEVCRYAFMCAVIAVSPLCVMLLCCRKHWEEESGKKGDRFNVEDVMGNRGADHDMLLKRASVITESVFGSGKGVFTLEQV